MVTIYVLINKKGGKHFESLLKMRTNATKVNHFFFKSPLFNALKFLRSYTDQIWR